MSRKEEYNTRYRERIRQAVKEAEEAEEDFSQDSSSSVGPTESISSSHSSLHTPVIKVDIMEEANAALMVSLRKKLERLLNKAGKTRESLARKKDTETPDTIDVGVFTGILNTLTKQQTEYEALSAQLYDGETNPTAMEEDETKADEWERTMEAAIKDCTHLISQGTIHSSISSLEVDIETLTAAYEATPENDHSTAITDVVNTARQLKADLKKSLMPREEELRGHCKTC